MLEPILNELNQCSYIWRVTLPSLPPLLGKNIYSLSNQQKQHPPTQAQKDFGQIIQTFGTPAKPPRHLKKGAGAIRVRICTNPILKLHSIDQGIGAPRKWLNASS